MTVKKKRTIVVLCAIAVGILLPILYGLFCIEAAYQFRFNVDHSTAIYQMAEEHTNIAEYAGYVIFFPGIIFLGLLEPLGGILAFFVGIIGHLSFYGLMGWIIARIFIRPVKPMSNDSRN